MKRYSNLPREIVKVQVALVPRGAPALIYDKERKHVSQQILASATVKSLNADLKGYFDAAWNGHRWIVGNRVEQPKDW